MLDQDEFFECECSSDEHTLRFILHLDELTPPEKGRIPELYTSVFLHEWGFFKRVWIGLKYIFGYKCKYGHFDSFTMKPSDGKRLINMIERFTKACDESIVKRD